MKKFSKSMTNSNASKWNKLMIFLSVVVLIIEVSLVVLLFVSGRVVWLNSVDINAFLGTFVSICTTFIVGFQIWNYIYASDKLKEFEEEKKLLKQEIQELKVAKFECLYFNAYTIGRMRYQMAKGYHNEEKDKRNYWNALRAFTNALLYAKEGGHDFEDTYDAISGMVFSSIDSIIESEDYMMGYFTEDSKCLIMMETINDNMNELQTFIRKEFTYIPKYTIFLRYVKKWERIYTSILQIKDATGDIHE